MAHTTLLPPTRPGLAWRRLATLAACGLAVLAAATPAQAEAMDPFTGALMPMAGKPGGSTCPKDWLPAEGQLLPIQGYTALYSLLGVTYGGNGTSNFQLPDLRGRAAVGAGQGPGLSDLPLGAQGGSTHATLTMAHLPAHSHGLAATTAAATHATPDTTHLPAQAQNAGIYASGGPQVTLAQSGPAGQGIPVPTTSPYLTIIWCIAVNGSFPPRP